MSPKGQTLDIMAMDVIMATKQINAKTLSKMSGVPEATISKIRKGRPAQDKTVRKLARALEVETETLYLAGEEVIRGIADRQDRLLAAFRMLDETRQEVILEQVEALAGLTATSENVKHGPTGNVLPEGVASQVMKIGRKRRPGQ